MTTASLSIGSSRNVAARLATVAACLFGIAGAALAETPTDEAPSINVRYGDLDLSTTNGADKLYVRIKVAATRVCPEVDNRNLAAFAAMRTCRSGAIARAVHEVNSPRLAATYAAHTNRG
jgi:UrcA family protein